MKDILRFVKLGCVAAFTVGLTACSPSKSPSSEDLRLDPEAFRIDSIEMPMGGTVKFKVYEGLYFVSNVVDSTYQTLNIYIPIDKKDGESTPIFLRTYVGGYMASEAKTPSGLDATGRALQEGFIVCIPGSRGWNSTIMRDGQKIYDGTAPATLLDLKAAIRYLRHNSDLINGDTERIFTDGTSAGGAMSSLLGATGNAEVYELYLKEMGAAQQRDDVFAAICYCPIIDLNHADMEYEWLYGCTNDGVRHLDEAQKIVSDELSALCPDYINSLGLKSMFDGTEINADNYKEYLSRFIIESAHQALENGCEIPDSIGIEILTEPPFGGRPDDREAPSFGPNGINRSRKGRPTDFVTGIDLDRYLSYVASQQQLKTPPAFDQMGVIIPYPSPENNVFGNEEGQPANFTDFSLRKRLEDPNASISEDMKLRVMMFNPMDFIDTGNSTVTENWYIRHGAKDRDTSFLVPINLATKLHNNGKNVDFALPWNRPHSGDYNLDDLFAWIKTVLQENN